jgi:hypothetical protein
MHRMFAELNSRKKLNRKISWHFLIFYMVLLIKRIWHEICKFILVKDKGLSKEMTILNWGERRFEVFE